MATDRIDRLKNIQMMLPANQQKVANQYKAANDLLLQKSIAQAPNTSSAVQNAIIGTAATQQGQQQIQQTQQQAQQSQAVAQMGQQAQQAVFQQANVQAQRGLQNKEFDAKQKLSQLDENAKQELFDSRLDLVRTKNTDKFMSERQLADYAKLRAVSDEDLKTYQQTLDFADRRSELLMKAAYSKLEQELVSAQRRRDTQAMQQLSIGLENIKAQAAARAAKKKRKGAILSTIVGAIGTGVGAAYGGSTGAMAGGSFGSGIGGAIGSS